MCNSCEVLPLPECVTNAKRRIKVRVSKQRRKDPTGTVTLRRRFMAEMNRRFASLKRDVMDAVVIDDVFGLRERRTTTALFNESPGPRAYAFESNPQKYSSFMQWFSEQTEDRVLTPDRWTDQYIEAGYNKGVMDSFGELKKRLPKEDLEDIGFGVSTMSKQQYLSSFVAGESLELLYLRAYEGLQGINREMSSQIGRVLADGLAAGDNPLTIAVAINDRVDKIGVARARTLARTEVVRAHAEGALDNYQRMGQLDIAVLAEWSTAGDDRVCPLCEPLDGVVMPLREARGLLPRHPNCLPGDSLVSPVGRITAASKRWYDGDMVIINTTAGDEISCTPNHPVCTDKGFIPARLVDESTKMVRNVSAHGVFGAVDRNNINAPSRIEDVFESFLNDGKVSSCPVPLSAEDFHGDSSDGNVAIIGTDCRLSSNIFDSSFLKHFDKINFVLRNVAGLILICLCAFALLLPRVLTPARRLVSIFSYASLLLFGHSGSPEGLGFLGSPGINTSANKPSPDSVPANAKSFCKRVFRHSIIVKFCDFINRKIDSITHNRILSSSSFEIVDVSKKTTKPFSGYVYNIETTAYYYIADNLSTHNCRCSYLPVIPEEGKRAGQKTGKEAEEAISTSISRETGTQPSRFAESNPKPVKRIEEE